MLILSSRKNHFSNTPFNNSLSHVSFISTMETETVSSRNVVDLLLKNKYNTTICGTSKSETVKDDYVYGWDC